MTQSEENFHPFFKEFCKDLPIPAIGTLRVTYTHICIYMHILAYNLYYLNLCQKVN